MDYSLAIVGGRLVSDPEREEGEIPVAAFDVVTTRKWTKKDGTKSEAKTTIHVRTERRLAEICLQFLKKGRGVLVVGRFEERSGSYVLAADTVQFLDGRKEE